MIHTPFFRNHCAQRFGKDSSGLDNKPRIETKFNYVKIPHTVVVLAKLMIIKSPRLQFSNTDQQQKSYTFLQEGNFALASFTFKCTYRSDYPEPMSSEVNNQPEQLKFRALPLRNKHSSLQILIQAHSNTPIEGKFPICRHVQK